MGSHIVRQIKSFLNQLLKYLKLRLNSYVENYFKSYAQGRHALCVGELLLVYLNAHRKIRKRMDIDVALHHKVFQNTKLKETCVNLTKSNLTQNSNKA